MDAVCDVDQPYTDRGRHNHLVSIPDGNTSSINEHLRSEKIAVTWKD